MSMPMSPKCPNDGGRCPSIGKRLHGYWLRHRTLFWTLHSLWSLTIGIGVIFLSHERYEFVPMVVLFLILAWASTLFFSRQFAVGMGSTGVPRIPGMMAEVTSYLTRSMYQETLFFLLPFYWYSTVVDSPNVVFTTLLVGLAGFSCYDLVFDRWLRTRPLFALVFFATVAFAAINLLLPMFLLVDPVFGTPLAAVVAVGSSIPLAIRGTISGRGQKSGLALLGVAFLALSIGLPRLVAPVPLRLQNATFTSEIDRDSLIPADSLGRSVNSDELHGVLFIIVEVFAPSNVPTHVRLDWKRDGELIHSSREIEITAHTLGFRVWDGYRPETGEVVPGRYEVVLRTDGQRVFGLARIDVRAK